MHFMPLYFTIKQGETEKVVDVPKLEKLTLGRIGQTKSSNFQVFFLLHKTKCLNAKSFLFFYCKPPLRTEGKCLLDNIMSPSRLFQHFILVIWNNLLIHSHPFQKFPEKLTHYYSHCKSPGAVQWMLLCIVTPTTHDRARLMETIRSF